ncbi:microfibril-associated glycoprotein 4 isoform X2 [Scaptodrosophila lebanonensis]|uniref:Microfibril-associated glycoprotein 4 isoform X2 n=1 Tax=Drosophila lebanonensis TaxID=7225 RepID=A0A6J2TVC5_DROLE|nr:microfibril-associated glycoprotein 4 isoform X2 [Scaptodrosophila lebanonensis]
MSKMLQLDTLVTMLACLTSTQNELNSEMLKSLPIDNSTAGTCPISALSGFTNRLQALATDMASIKEQVGSLQEQLVDLRRTATSIGATPLATLPIALGSRFLDTDILDPQALVPAAPATKGPTTPHNCVKQEHGVVRIRPGPNIEPFYVFCDQKVRGGGWTVVANRYDGSEDFNRKWVDYKIGFGSLTTEFFIGLDKLHWITVSDNYELLVQLHNREEKQRYALYDQFSIGSESEQYRLNVLGNHTGDAADALRQHAGKKFSTSDQDNTESGANCATAQSAAFWYSSSCNLSNPFGIYQRILDRNVDGYKGILWRGFLDGPKGSLKRIRLSVRPKAA